MGQVKAKIKVENLVDVLLAERGELPPEKVRQVEIEALVDTEATLLCLPSGVIKELGLSPLGASTVSTAAGPAEKRIFRGAQLTILGRTCTVDVLELEDGIPALVGYFPLENLDLRPDPQKGTLIPQHGDEIILDLYEMHLRSIL